MSNPKQKKSPGPRTTSSQVPTPVEISDASLVFPADALEYMPKWEDIPEEFREGRSPWQDLVRHLLFRGLSEDFMFQAKDGLDPNTIWRQLRAIAGSFAPKHEHKEAALEFLMSVWIESVVYGSPGTERKDMKVLGSATLEEWQEFWDSGQPVQKGEGL